MKTLRESIADHPFSLGLKPEYIDILAAGASETLVQKGDILIREGEPANQFYLIESGHIAVESRRLAVADALVQTVGPGEALGWSWLFPPFSWNFQARAVEAGRLLVLDGNHLLGTVEQNPGFGYELIKRVARVVIRRLQAIRKQIYDLAAVEVLKARSAALESTRILLE